MTEPGAQLEVIVEDRSYTTTHRLDMSQIAADAHIKVAEARFATPARWLTGGVVVALAILVVGVIAVCQIEGSDTVKSVALAAVAVGVGGPTAFIFRKLLDKLGTS